MSSDWLLIKSGRFLGITGMSDHVEPIEYLTDGEVFVVPEMDGLRMISSKTHELIRRVPASLVDVLGMSLFQEPTESENAGP